MPLKRLLRKNRGLRQALVALLEEDNAPCGLLADDGELLLGHPSAAGVSQEAVMLDGIVAGWVGGPAPRATTLAALLTALLAQETEKRALATELLDKYRELNLLYTLSERLLVEPDPHTIARLALVEAGRLIDMSGGWLLLDDGDELTALSSTGSSHALRPHSSNDDLRQQVLATREAQIVNNADAGSYVDGAPFDHCALLCAPLKTEQRVLGVILLLGAPPITYSAHDRKLLNTVALQVAPALEMARLYQMAVENGRMERELQLAYQVQSGLIPKVTPQVAGWQFAGRWRPARELSGDYYDFIENEDGKIGLVIGDVADKGMPSALFMVHTRAAVRSAVGNNRAPAEAITAANRLVHAESKRGHFVTLIYGCLDTTSGDLAYVNAGHNPALHYRARDHSIHELTRTGLPLGITLDAPFAQGHIRLQAGDVLLLYTDGLTEAVNERQEQFGAVRLREMLCDLVHASAGEIATALEQALADYVGAERPFDDLALVVVRAVGT